MINNYDNKNRNYEIIYNINQFKDNHYYAIVESYVDKLYLLSLTFVNNLL